MRSDDNDSWPAKWIAHEIETAPIHAEELAETSWIWLPSDRRHLPEKMSRANLALFRKSFQIESPRSLRSAQLFLTADNACSIYLNGELIGENDYWRTIRRIDLKPLLVEGENTLAVRVENKWVQHENLRGGNGSPAGLIAKLTLDSGSDAPTVIATGAHWLVSPEEAENWMRPDFDDSNWKSATVSSVRGVTDWTGADEYSNRWYCYRKNFHLETTFQPLVARIAADSKYWLWINGELAVFEGAVKRGPDPQNTYYDTVDLSRYLRKGENTIAILAWYWGRSGFSHNDSGRHALYFDMEADDRWIVSDESWKSALHPAYKNSDPPYPNYRLPEFNVHFDAREDIGDWFAPDYDDRAWGSANAVGQVPDAPWNQLVDRLIPQWFDSGLVDYENEVDFPFVSDGEVIEMDLPYNAQVTPYFEIKAPAGQLVDLRMDNYVGGSEQTIRSEYVTRDGIQEFETYAWMNGHKVQYRFPEGTEVLDLKYRETAFDAPIDGAFESDDPDLNELWQRSLRTLIVCMRDTYYDCPDRERAQWWGDAVIEVGQSFYALDRISDTLTQKAIRELVDWQRDDHTFFSPVPSGKWNAELPGQMLMSIGRFGFWTYYWFSGDQATIAYAYPSIRPYLELWKLDSDGLIANRQGEWYWGDWGRNKDTRILDNCYYYLALDGAKRMAELLGETDDLPFYEGRMRSIKENFDRVFWQGSEYRSPDYEGETDDRGHGLAVVAGLANPENYDAIAKVLETEYQASPYVEKYILEALFQMGRPDQALARMKQRYRTHLEVPITTLFEGWGIGSEGFGGGTINHSWSGGPLTLLSQYVAGIEPLETGFERFKIQPKLGPLNAVSATVPSTRGLIEASVVRSSKQIEQSVSIPKSTVCELSIPLPDDSSVAELTVNDELLYDGSTWNELSSAQALERGPGITLQLEPGRYQILAKLQ